MKTILIKNSAVRKDRSGSKSPQSFSPDHSKVYFFLKPAYPEKNPASQKIELIQGVFGLLLIIKSGEMIPGLSMG